MAASAVRAARPKAVLEETFAKKLRDEPTHEVIVENTFLKVKAIALGAEDKKPRAKSMPAKQEAIVPLAVKPEKTSWADMVDSDSDQCTDADAGIERAIHQASCREQRTVRAVADNKKSPKKMFCRLGEDAHNRSDRQVVREHKERNAIGSRNMQDEVLPTEVDCPPELDALLNDLFKRHPPIAREIANTAATSLKFQYLKECGRGCTKIRRQEIWNTLGEEEKQNLTDAHLLGEGLRDELFLKIVEEDRAQRAKLVNDVAEGNADPSSLPRELNNPENWGRPSKESIMQYGTRCLDSPDDSVVFRDRRGNRPRWSAHDTSQKLADQGLRPEPDDREDMEDLLDSASGADWLRREPDDASNQASRTQTHCAKRPCKDQRKRFKAQELKISERVLQHVEEESGALAAKSIAAFVQDICKITLEAMPTKIAADEKIKPRIVARLVFRSLVRLDRHEQAAEARTAVSHWLEEHFILEHFMNSCQGFAELVTQVTREEEFGRLDF